MAAEAIFRRVLVKISGEAFCSPGGFGIDAAALEAIADELAPVHKMGVDVGLVVGGGNFLRGKTLAQSDRAVLRATADSMGMLATVMNALALQDTLEHRRVDTRVLSAIPTAGMCEPWIRRRAIRHLEKHRLIILAGGTGNPFFTTDTCAALRASEIGADVLMKATKVDGVFDSDPVKNPAAQRFERLTYGEALALQLGVMDLAAVSLCMESKIPVLVFRMGGGNLARACRGDSPGTMISGS